MSSIPHLLSLPSGSSLDAFAFLDHYILSSFLHEPLPSSHSSSSSSRPSAAAAAADSPPDSPPDMQEMQQSLQKIARVALRAVAAFVFFSFAWMGIIYNVSAAAVKGGMGLGAKFVPNLIGKILTDIPEGQRAQRCFKEAAKHLAFALIDYGAFTISPFVAGAYAFAPQDFIDTSQEISDQIRAGQIVDHMFARASH